MTEEATETEVRNYLSELRQKRGISAAQLASMVGVSRQSIYAMESGSYVPNTVIALKLARVLAVSVEDIFLLQEKTSATETVDAHLLFPVSGGRKVQPGQPLHLCDVHGHLVAVPAESGSWSLPVADGIVSSSSGTTVQVEVLGDEERGLDKRLLIAGCDPSAPVLGHHLRAHGVDLVVVYQNSSHSLELLKQGMVHIAGTHITEGDKESTELAAIRKIFAKQQIEVVRYALWDEGILVSEDNPKEIRGIEDFTRRNVKIVNREPGSGCRLLLDTHLKRLGIPQKSIRGYDQIELGHVPAARQVQLGVADCCISTRATARGLGLGFIPLASKWYDLVIYKKSMELPAVQALLQTLCQSSFRREMEGLWGYDMHSAGALLV